MKIYARITSRAILMYFFIRKGVCFVNKWVNIHLFVVFILVYSSLIASIGFTAMARYAGASPARSPSMISKMQAPIACQKLI